MSACGDATWHGSESDWLDTEQEHIPNLNKVTQSLLNKKMREVVRILGKPHATDNFWEFPYNTMDASWYIDDSTKVIICFGFPATEIGTDEFDAYNYAERWMNFGVAFEISVTDATGVIEHYTTPPIEKTGEAN